MGFTDLANEAGATALNSWLTTRSYITGHIPSQADIVCFKALSGAPDSSKHPHAARWYRHIKSFEGEFKTLPGNAEDPYTTYGPDAESPEATGDDTEAPKAAGGDDDDDVDLFGSDDEEDTEAARIRDERLAEYRKKKEAKPKTTAKSIVTLEVKPWDDETDMAALESSVRSIVKDGLVWGASSLKPVGFGIRKLVINLVVEDDKISLDELQEQIQEFEDHVQSTDVAAMQKL